MAMDDLRTKCERCSAQGSTLLLACKEPACPMVPPALRRQPTPGVYPESFANYPESINEHDSSPIEWTPREALIATLRELDSGEFVPKHLIIIVDDGDTRYKYAMSGATDIQALGLLEIAKHRIIDDGS